MKRLQKTAKGLDKLFSFIQKLTIAGCVFGGIVILFVWYLYIGDPDIAELLRGSLDFGSISFTLSPSVMPAENSFIWYLSLSTVLGIIELPILYMAFGSIRGILALMIDGTPFHEHIVHCIKRLGLLTLAGGIVDIASSLILQGNLLTQYDLNALFLNDKITGFTVQSTWDFTFVLFAVVLFLLAQVFQYGLELQQLSDETL